MPSFASLTSIKFLFAAGLVAATVSPALARGGAPGAFNGGQSFGIPGNPAGIYARGPGRFAATGTGRFGRGRFDARRSYYPSAPFGPFGGGFYGASPASGDYANAPPYVDTAPRTVTIIQRGPAFGEPGYVSRPAIYRLTPAERQTPGTRRFKVERLEF